MHQAGGRLQKAHKQGFTLIELSIVLVIIGLIIGGILVGQDLIRAAGVRATISQIEQYNTAANTFRVKYDYLPGDIPDPAASNFGLAARGTHTGEGDGNGVITGNLTGTSSTVCPYCEGAGETVMFWRDLSVVGLVDGAFNVATSNSVPGYTITDSSSVSTRWVSAYIPQARLGGGNYIYVWSGGLSSSSGGGRR
jgi:prepilin-type N-terminal cleavage/methylation domain-containing protein